MSQARRGTIGRACALTLLILATITFVAVGQEKPKKPPENQSPPEQSPEKKPPEKVTDRQPAPAATSIVLVLRVGPRVTKSELLNAFTVGSKKLGGDGKVELTPISAAFYQLLDPTTRDLQPAGTSASVNGITIDPISGAEGLRYRLTIADAKEVLQEVKVSLKSKEKADRTYKPARDAKAPLQVNGELGNYILSLPAEEELLECSVTLARLDGDEKSAKTRTVPVRVPLSERYYKVSLPGFRGETTKLLEMVKDKNTLGNPLDEVRLGQTVTLMPIGVGVAEVRVGDVFERNEFIPRVEGLPPDKRIVKRVRMLWPLTEEEMHRELARYSKLETTELPDEMDKNAVKSDTKEPFKVSATDKPMWYPLADTGNAKMFSCRLLIEDPKAWQERYKQVYRLIVYEHESATDGRKEAIFVLDKAGVKNAVTGVEVIQWASGIGKIVENETEPKTPMKQPGEIKVPETMPPNK